LAIPEHAWEGMSMDFIEGLPKSEGRDAILVIVDRLTKFAYFISLTHPYTAPEIARKFMDTVGRVHGIPKSIVSDRDKIFTSSFWQGLFKGIGVGLHMSTAYHPQTDGQTERVNQCLEAYLRCTCLAKPRSWNRWLSMAQWWYNTSYHSSLKQTPFEALFGHPAPVLPTLLNAPVSVAAVDDYLLQRQHMLQLLKKELTTAQNRMKQTADKRRSEREFEVGDRVYLKVKRFLQHSFSPLPVTKLSPKYFGPYVVLARVGKVAYKLQLPHGTPNHPVFHVSLLKKAIEPTAPTSTTLPTVAEDEENMAQPQAIIDKRITYQGTMPLTEVLVQWSHLHPENVTWEYLPALLSKYPRAAQLLSFLGDK